MNSSQEAKFSEDSGKLMEKQSYILLLVKKLEKPDRKHLCTLPLAKKSRKLHEIDRKGAVDPYEAMLT